MLNQRITYFPQRDGTRYEYEVLTFDFDMWGVKAEVPNNKNISSFHEEMEFLRREKKREERLLMPLEHRNLEKSFKRAQKRAFELICSNYDLDQFVTLTLSFDREDYQKTIRAMNQWLDNMVRRKGLRYVLVPEYHDDKQSIHFHGVMNSSALTLWGSGQMHGKKPICNIKEWKRGYSTAIKISDGKRDWQRVAKRILDYMMKDSYGRVGGRWYLHGGDLREPIYEYHQADYFTARGNEYCADRTITYKLYRSL